GQETGVSAQDMRPTADLGDAGRPGTAPLLSVEVTPPASVSVMAPNASPPLSNAHRASQQIESPAKAETSSLPNTIAGPLGVQDRIYGALDLGTNNCRLLVARPSRRGFFVIDAFSRIIKLGEGISHSGILSDEAIDRTLEALKVCAMKMERRGVTRSRLVATE